MGIPVSIRTRDINRMNPRNIHPAFPRSSLASALTLAIVSITSIGLSGCAAPPPPPQRVVVREQMVERPAPQQIRYAPPPVHEDRGPSPGPGWNWVQGHWHWVGNDWTWAQGHWVQQAVAPMPTIIVEQITPPPAPHSYWIPGHWVWRGESGNWVWAKGVWHE